MTQDSSLTESRKALNNLNLEKISYYILLVLAFLLPIFFIPSNIFPFQFGKTLILSLGGLLSLSFWIGHKLREGKISLPTGPPYLVAIVILLIALISSLFSGVITRSLIGLGLETDTFFTVLMLFILMFMTSILFRSKKRIFNLYLTFFISSIILLVFQLLRAFLGVDFLSFGVLTNTTSNLLGRWNDLAIFFGLYSLMSVVTLEFFRPSKILKILLYITLVLSVLFMVVINSLMAWLTLGVLSLVLLIYLALNGRPSQDFRAEVENHSKNVTVIAKLPIILVLLSVVFVLVRGPVGSAVSSRLGIIQISARPSTRSTLDIAKSSLPNNPAFGVGPNRFATEWSLYKPNLVNNTPFWNVNFNFGIGVIPTTLVTTGILGFISWIAFLGALILLGIKALFSSPNNNVSRFLIVSSFLATLFLWTFSVIYVPGIAVLALTFMMTGAFLSTMFQEGFIKDRQISFTNSSKVGFVSVFALIAFLIINIGLGYFVVTRYISATYFQRTLVAVNIEGNIEKGGENINRAVSFAKTDRNYRLLSQLHIANLNSVLNEEDLSQTEEGRIRFQTILGQAIASAQEATKVDKNNYQNWLSLGNIYEAIVPLGIEGSYESAKNTYEEAEKVAPTNPSVDLVLARLEVVNGDNDKAREHIVDALTKKNNYTEAIFLLSQIEINEGNITEAINSVEAASFITPNDPIVFFQLGFLRYNQGDFSGAISALERAVILNPPYSNAKYFLGLGYFNVGRTEEAIFQFQDIELLNPDNPEVKSILANLREGRGPFTNSSVEAPEEREDLPVEN